MNRRAFVVVLDACGAGELPDAADYGDAGSNTLGHVSEAAGGLDLPVLGRLGLGSILPLEGVPPAEEPVLHGRLHPLGPGKDTITGHWELMGVVTPVPLRTYPDGFPDEIIEQLIDATGRGVLLNKPYSGTDAIEDYGEQHLATGNLIVYTSADSVLQIAAHVDEVPPAELYAACEAAREIMSGEHAVGRVIARPFRGEPGAFERTTGRRDLALEPPGRSYLEELRTAASRSTRSARSSRCSRASASTAATRAPPTRRRSAGPSTLIDELDGGLVFANFVETDQVYGHRGDVARLPRGAARSSTRRSAAGSSASTPSATCSSSPPTTAATRPPPAPTTRASTCRCWPASPATAARRHDGPLADVGASALRWLAGRDAPALPGEPFVP